MPVSLARPIESALLVADRAPAGTIVVFLQYPSCARQRTSCRGHCVHLYSEWVNTTLDLWFKFHRYTSTGHSVSPHSLSQKEQTNPLSQCILKLMASFITSPLLTRSPPYFRTLVQPRRPPYLYSRPIVRSMATASASPADALSLMKSETPTTYLDVRTPEEFKAGHAPNAVNVPVSLGSGPLPSFVSDVEKLYSRDTPLLVGCKSGKRSTMAIRLLTQAGFENLTEVEGGFDAWKSDTSLPIEN